MSYNTYPEYCCICIDDLENKINHNNTKEENDESSDILNNKNIFDNSQIYKDNQLYFLNCCNNKIHKNCLLEWVIFKGILICPLCRKDPSCITVDDLLSFNGNINYNNLTKLVNELVSDNIEIKIISIDDTHSITESYVRYDMDRNSSIKFYTNLILYTTLILFFIFLISRYNNSHD